MEPRPSCFYCGTTADLMIDDDGDAICGDCLIEEGLSERGEEQSSEEGE